MLLRVYGGDLTTAAVRPRRRGRAAGLDPPGREHAWLGAASRPLAHGVGHMARGCVPGRVCARRWVLRDTRPGRRASLGVTPAATQVRGAVPPGGRRAWEARPVAAAGVTVRGVRDPRRGASGRSPGEAPHARRRMSRVRARPLPGPSPRRPHGTGPHARAPAVPRPVQSAASVDYPRVRCVTAMHTRTAAAVTGAAQGRCSPRRKTDQNNVSSGWASCS